MFLEKVCQCPFPNQSKEWCEVTYYNKIRNKIVHADGYVKDGDKPDPLREYAAKHSGIAINEQNRIRLEHGFCMEAVNIVQQCLEHVLDDLN